VKVKELHPWNVTYRVAVALQQSLRDALILEDAAPPGTIETIAGADISYAKKSDLFFASVLLFSFPSLALVDEASFVGRSTFPYIPGLLSFREGPALLRAFAALRQAPDCVIFDGQGIAHPRRIGLASHVGLFLDVPSIGCAKKRLVGCHDEVGVTAGDAAPLTCGGETVGAVLRTKGGVKPVFVSPGHRVSLGRAVEITLACCRGYRLPEPVRRAHLAVNKLRLAHGPSQEA
jgi:deoxyribonuclease V